MAGDWVIWQIADSAFPSGGFAHSGGLEAAWQHGVVTDAASLVKWLGASMHQLHRGVLGFVLRSRQAPGHFGEIDSACDLFLNNHVTNRASRAQGRAFLAAAGGAFASPAVVQLSQVVREQHTAGHFAPVFGLVCNELGIELGQTSGLFGFVLLRSQISVAVRLGIIGPLEGQRLQADLSTEFESIVKRPVNPQPVQISPITDLVQGTQDRLYSRLFQS